MQGMTSIRGRYTITLEYELNNVLAADSVSTIKPLLLPDGSYDQIALDEYTDFIVNVLEIFDEKDFTVIEENESPTSKSYYCALVKREDAERKDYKYILYIRLSDHPLSSNGQSRQREYFAEQAELMKEPKTKSKQVWKLKKITVNKDTYYSYDDALDDIRNRILK